MTDLPLPLIAILEAAVLIKYPLLFLATILEGPVIMVAAGFLFHLGHFPLIPLFCVLVIADITGDIIWFFVGRHFLEPFLKRHGHFLSVTPELLEKAKDLFRRYNVKILFISKVTLGFGMALATLMAAGASGMRFRTYLFINLAGELFLVAGLMAVGYFFGQVYSSLESGLRVGFMVVAGAIAVAAIFGFSKYIKHKFTPPL